MPESKYKIVKDCWGSRANFQASYGLRTTPEAEEEGDRILEEMQRHDASRSHQDVETETESDWIRKNREGYEAGGRNLLKEELARQWAKEYNFPSTGDPEMDLIVAMGMRDMENGSESDDPIDLKETAGSSSKDARADRPPEVKKSKRQMKLERQRESARKFNEQRSSR